jgi:formate/nitrite transporter
MSGPMSGVELYTPAEIATAVETKGVTRAAAPAGVTFVLGMLAGAFIALGGVLSTVISTGSELGFGPTRWLAGLGFSVGLILVIVAGAELFTGNTLVVMSWVSRDITLGRLLRNWAIVYAGNLVGAVSVAVMVVLAEWWAQDDAALGGTALTIAAGKTGLSFGAVFFRGILANALVCLAVWLATGGRTLVDKIVAIVFPIAAFVAAGFEHSIANLYFLPVGLLVKDEPAVREAAGLTAAQLAHVNLAGTLRNVIASTLGNVVGGAVLVGLVYWYVYLRPQAREEGER